MRLSSRFVEFRTVVAQAAHQHGSLVADLAEDNAADDVLGRVRGSILSASQKHISRHRTLYASTEPAAASKQDDGNAGTGACSHQGGRKIDRTEDDDRAEHVQWYAGALDALHIDHDILSVLPEACAFRRDVKRIEKLLHCTSPSPRI